MIRIVRCLQRTRTLVGPTSIISYFSCMYFSHYKSMGTISCHSNQSSYPTGIKKHNFSFPLPIDAICGIWK